MKMAFYGRKEMARFRILTGEQRRAQARVGEQGMELKKVRKVLVVGLGISGRSAAEKLLREGKEVTLNDLSNSEAIRAAATELSRSGARVTLGHHDFGLLEGIDLVVVSPGVAGRLPLLGEAEARGIPVWSEIELAWRFARGRVVAVTGTNGKTTTVSMIEWILKQAGRPAMAAGNIGYPLVKAVEEARDGDVLVVEVSSFQLAYIEDFRPFVAVLLNMAEDHFDWHENMQEYIDAKSRIWMNQGESDIVVCNLDDPLCAGASRSAPSRLAFFSTRAGNEAATYISDGTIFSRLGQGGSLLMKPRPIMRVNGLTIAGKHNLENAMAAASAALLLDVEPEVAGKALAEFRGLAHRLQLVAEVEGLKFYNDSKATNPHAAMRALTAFEQPLILILGGRNKGLGFEELARQLETSWLAGGIRVVYLIGEAAEEIGRTIAQSAPEVKTMMLPGLEEVFEDLPSRALPGDVILFSPACASFDRYGNYKERGKHFQAMAEEYQGERRGDE